MQQSAPAERHSLRWILAEIAFFSASGEREEIKMGKLRSKSGARILLTVMGLAAIGLGCWKSEAPVSDGPAPVVAEAKQKVPAPTPVPPKSPMRVEPAPAGTPAVLPLLRLTPQSAAFAFSAPSVNALLDKSIALAKRLAPPDSVQPQVDEAVKALAMQMEVPESATFAELARNLGFDPEFPVAIYVNPDASIRAIGEMTPPVPNAAPAGANQAAPAADVHETAAAEPESAQPAPATPAPVPPGGIPQPPTEFDMPAPDFAAIVGISDTVKAEASVKKFLEQSGVDLSQVKTSQHEEVTVNQFGEKTTYAIVGNVLLFGNRPEMVQEILERFQSPAEVRYGNPDVPLGGPDQAVFMSYLDKLLPPLRELMAAQEKAGANSFVNMQTQMMQDYEKAFSGGDPVIGTLDWTGEKIEIKSVIDWRTHPGLAALEGEATPFRLAPIVPENTLVLLAQRFNDVNREMLKKHWLFNMPPDMLKETGQEPLFNALKQAIDIISDELVITVYGEQMIPQVALIASIQDKAKAKDAISKLAPMTPAETYQDAEITQISVTYMPPIYVAFLDKLLVASNDLTGLKKLLDLAKSNGQTNFFGQLNPPIDPKGNYYGLFLLKSELVTKVLQPYLMMFGAPKEALDVVGRVTGTIAEVRAVRSKNDNWAQQDILIMLKNQQPPA
jgi:hypothetical protein